MARNLRCPCPNKTCLRHGDCKECREYHGENRPYCMRPISETKPKIRPPEEEAR
jgi:hypothetical protein